MVSLLKTLVLSAFVHRAVAQTYNTIWFQPGSTITTLQTTMLIPAVPAKPGIHYIWPGLQPNSDLFVFQDVAGDEDSNSWTFAEWEVDSNDNYNKTADINVYPGDSVAVNFTLNTANGEWYNSWAITPGSAGKAAGEVYTINSIIAPKDQNTVYGQLTQALFAIELQENAVWNFGSLKFTNTKIVAETTATTWCTSPYIDGTFAYTLSKPTATVSGKTSTCSVASLVLVSPS